MTVRSATGESQMTSFPAGLHLARLSDQPGSSHDAARTFCLDVIKEFYDFDYRADWHADLDSLRRPAVENHYSSLNRGAFWTLSRPDGTLLATAGIRHLGWKPLIVKAFAERYPDGESIASLWRVYVRKDERGRGLGTSLNLLAEREAASLGFTHMYLHASSDAAATLGFWRSTGYAEIGAFGDSIHFDKRLEPSPVGAGARRPLGAPKAFENGDLRSRTTAGDQT